MAGYYDPLPTAEEMRRLDEAAVAFGILPEILMENAARACLGVLLAECGPVSGRSVLILAGPGNNGGDGFCLARHLADAGAAVTLLHTKPWEAYTGAAGYHAALLRKRSALAPAIQMHRLDGALPEPLRQQLTGQAWDVVVDALLGTGFTPPLRPDCAQLIELTNGLRRAGLARFVLAVDIPSGLCSLTGRPQPVAVAAQATATFQAAKPGLVLPEGQASVGRLHVRPIGIPSPLVASSARLALMTPRLAALLPATVAPGLHKGTAGKVLILGGAPGMGGAPHLAARGALRAGAGYAAVACTGQMVAEIKAGLPDILCHPVPGPHLDASSLEFLAPLLPRYEALVVGPGLGREEAAGRFVAALLAAARPVTVLDADALFHLAQRPEILPPSHDASQLVLTPHPGEAALLLGQTVEQVQAERLTAVRALADKYQAMVVLKGAGCLVTAPGRQVHLSPFATPNLAVAGSGDVLAGIMAALLVAPSIQANDGHPLDAVCLAVYLHGLAGHLLAEAFPHRGNLASEIADILPQAKKELYPCSPPATS